MGGSRERKKVREERRIKPHLECPFGRATTPFSRLSTEFGYDGFGNYLPQRLRGCEGLGPFATPCAIQCSGRHGQCTFKATAHEQLNGGAATRRAARYPVQLAKAIADVLVGAAWKRKRSGWLWDIFGGAGLVAKYSQQFGVTGIVVDTVVRSSDDACSYGFFIHLKKRLREGRIACVHLAPPCKSFSLAISRCGQAIRSQECPWGLPKLDQQEQRMVDEGNRAAKACLDILRFCLQNHAPISLETPKTSYFWHLPELFDTYQAGQKIDFHQCAFGSAWRKYTSLLFINCG